MAAAFGAGRDGGDRAQLGPLAGVGGWCGAVPAGVGGECGEGRQLAEGWEERGPGVRGSPRAAAKWQPGSVSARLAPCGPLRYGAVRAAALCRRRAARRTWLDSAVGRVNIQ